MNLRELRSRRSLKHAFNPVEYCLLDGRKLLVSFDRLTRAYHVGVDGWLSDETHYCADDAIKSLERIVDTYFGWGQQVPKDFKLKMQMMEETNG